MSFAIPAPVRRFTSAPITIASAAAGTVTHNLNETQVITFGVLKCVTAEHGYSIGDELQPISANVTVFGANYGFITYKIDNNSLGYTFGANPVSFATLHKTTGASVTLTNANWRLCLVCVTTA